MKNKPHLPYIICILIFAFYLIVLVDVLFVTRIGFFVNPFERAFSIENLMQGNINLVPFRTIRGYITVIRREGVRSITSFAVQNLYGNLALFLPMGFFLPVLFRVLRTFPRTFFVTTILVVCVELTQLVTQMGSCDIDDVILNLTGCVAGYLFYKVFSVFIPPLRRKKTDT